MSFRIEVKREDELTVLHMSGQLDAQALLELDRLCRSTPGSLCIDLTNLKSSEYEGACFIKELEMTGVELRGVSPYIRLLLQ